MKTIIYKNKAYKGIWFYGLSGSGKTFASKIVKNIIRDSIVIDGDDVRKYISTDLGMDLASRKIQLKRLVAISSMSIQSKIFPIVSGVLMNSYTKSKIQKNHILLIRINRDFEDIKLHATYKNNKNVVGIDIFLPNLNNQAIFNNNTKLFNKKISNLVKKKV